jgi:transketolase
VVTLAPMRQAYADALVELGHTRPEVVVLTADVQTSDYSYRFGEEFPQRYVNVGIAEMALIDVAVGLANAGFSPFANTFAVFIASRALEPILTHLCYGRANVKLMAGYAGLSPQFEGPTHHAIADIAAMRSLPGMTIVAPSDPMGMARLLPQVASWPGPVYFRFSRNEVPVLFDETYRPRIGEAVSLRTGRDLTIVANGMMVSRALWAADSLIGEGIDAGVIEIHTIKPIDRTHILSAAEQTRAIVTAEEHSVIGGLGSAVAELVAEAGVPAPVVRVGLGDRFACSGPHTELLEAFGMAVSDIAAAARTALSLRR